MKLTPLSRGYPLNTSQCMLYTHEPRGVHTTHAVWLPGRELDSMLTMDKRQKPCSFLSLELCSLQKGSWEIGLSGSSPASLVSLNKPPLILILSFSGERRSIFGLRTLQVPRYVWDRVRAAELLIYWLPGLNWLVTSGPCSFPRGIKLFELVFSRSCSIYIFIYFF